MKMTLEEITAAAKAGALPDNWHSVCLGAGQDMFVGDIVPANENRPAVVVTIENNEEGLYHGLCIPPSVWPGIPSIYPGF